MVQHFSPSDMFRLRRSLVALVEELKLRKKCEIDNEAKIQDLVGKNHALQRSWDTCQQRAILKEESFERAMTELRQEYEDKLRRLDTEQRQKHVKMESKVYVEDRMKEDMRQLQMTIFHQEKTIKGLETKVQTQESSSEKTLSQWASVEKKLSALTETYQKALDSVGRLERDVIKTTEINRKVAYIIRHHECQMRDKCSELVNIQEELLQVKIRASTHPSEVSETKDMRDTIEMLISKINKLEKQEEKQKEEVDYQSGRAGQAIASLQAAHMLVNKHLESANKYRAETEKLFTECASLTVQCCEMKTQLSAAEERAALSIKEAKEEWYLKENQLGEVIKTKCRHVESLEECVAELKEGKCKLYERHQNLVQQLEQAQEKLDFPRSDSSVLAGCSFFCITDRTMQTSQDVYTMATQASPPETVNGMCQTDHNRTCSSFAQTDHQGTLSNLAQTNNPRTWSSLAQTNHSGTLSSLAQTVDTAAQSATVQASLYSIPTNDSHHALLNYRHPIPRDTTGSYMSSLDARRRWSGMSLSISSDNYSSSHSHESSHVTQINCSAIKHSECKFSDYVAEKRTSFSISDHAKVGRFKHVAKIDKNKESDGAMVITANSNVHGSSDSFPNDSARDGTTITQGQTADFVESFQEFSSRQRDKNVTDMCVPPSCLSIVQNVSSKEKIQFFEPQKKDLAAQNISETCTPLSCLSINIDRNSMISAHNLPADSVRPVQGSSSRDAAMDVSNTCLLSNCSSNLKNVSAIEESNMIHADGKATNSERPVQGSSSRDAAMDVSNTCLLSNCTSNLKNVSAMEKSNMIHSDGKTIHSLRPAQGSSSRDAAMDASNTSLLLSCTSNLNNTSGRDEISLVRAHNMTGEPVDYTALKAIHVSDNVEPSEFSVISSDALNHSFIDKPRIVCVIDSAIVKIEAEVSGDGSSNDVSTLDHLQHVNLFQEGTCPQSRASSTSLHCSNTCIIKYEDLDGTCNRQWSDTLSADSCSHSGDNEDKAVYGMLSLDSHSCSCDNEDEAVYGMLNLDSCIRSCINKDEVQDGQLNIDCTDTVNLGSVLTTDHHTTRDIKSVISQNMQQILTDFSDSPSSCDTFQEAKNPCDIIRFKTSSINNENIHNHFEHFSKVSMPLPSSKSTDSFPSSAENSLDPHIQKPSFSTVSKSEVCNYGPTQNNASAEIKGIDLVPHHISMNEHNNKRWRKSGTSSKSKLTFPRSVHVLNIDSISSFTSNYMITYKKDGTAVISGIGQQVSLECGENIGDLSPVQSSGKGDICVGSVQSSKSERIYVERVQSLGSEGVRFQSSNLARVSVSIERIQSLESGDICVNLVQSSGSDDIYDRVQSLNTAIVSADCVQITGSDDTYDRVQSLNTAIVCVDRAQSSGSDNFSVDLVKSPGTTNICSDKRTNLKLSSNIHHSQERTSMSISHLHPEHSRCTKQEMRHPKEGAGPHQNLTCCPSQCVTDLNCFHTSENITTPPEEATDVHNSMHRIPHSLKLAKPGRLSRSSKSSSFRSSVFSSNVSFGGLSSDTVTRVDSETSTYSPLYPCQSLSLLVATRQFSVPDQDQECAHMIHQKNMLMHVVHQEECLPLIHQENDSTSLRHEKERTHLKHQGEKCLPLIHQENECISLIHQEKCTSLTHHEKEDISLTHHEKEDISLTHQEKCTSLTDQEKGISQIHQEEEDISLVHQEKYMSLTHHEKGNTYLVHRNKVLSPLTPKLNKNASMIHQEKKYPPFVYPYLSSNIKVKCNQNEGMKYTIASIFSTGTEQLSTNQMSSEPCNAETGSFSLIERPLYTSSNTCSLDQPSPKLSACKIGAIKRGKCSQGRSSVHKKKEKSFRSKSKNKRGQVMFLPSIVTRSIQPNTSFTSGRTSETKPKGILKGPHYNGTKPVKPKSVTFPQQLEYHMCIGDSQKSSCTKECDGSITSTEETAVDPLCQTQASTIGKRVSCPTEPKKSSKTDPSTDFHHKEGKYPPLPSNPFGNSPCGSWTIPCFTVPETPNLDISATDLSSSPASTAVSLESPVTTRCSQRLKHSSSETMWSQKSLITDTGSPVVKKHKKC